MIVISFGYQLPENGDKGSVWFPALEVDIQKLATHNHDGVNSALLSGSSISTGIVTAAAVDWVLVSTGVWRQVKNTPPSYSMDSSSISIRTLLGQYCYPTLNKLTTTTFEIFTNDPLQTFTVIFK